LGEETEESRGSRRKLLIAVVVIAVAIASVYGYMQYSSYQQQVVQTTVTTGNITNIKDITVSINTGVNLPGSPGQNNNNNQFKAPSTSRVTVAVGSTTFDQVLTCSPTPYRVGQSVMIDDNLLRNGQHQYVADLACRGGTSPFVSVTSSQTTSTHP
jgi:hypothetical protein